MNIEEWLRADARRDSTNPLEPRLSGLVQQVRARRRRRAATQLAGVVTAVAAGLVVWQVSGPWDRPAPPPATDPPSSDWCGQTVDQLSAAVAQRDLGTPVLESAGGQLGVSATLSSDTDLELSSWLDVLITDPDTGAVLGYSEEDRSGDHEDANVVVPADGETEVGRSLTLTWCTSAFTGAAAAYAGDITAQEGSWLTEPATVEFTEGALGSAEDETSGEEESGDGEQTTPTGEHTGDDADSEEDADSGDDTDGESTDPGAEVTAPESYEPACGQGWSPPSARTGWQVSADFGAGPFQASPDGASGGLSTEVTLVNTSAEELTADTYTQVVLVADDTILSPELLGSDDVRETTLAPGEETTQTAGHHLWDYCDESWTGVGPSVPAGEYTAYVLLLDAGPYWNNGERAVLAVSEGQTIEVAQ